ncbi:crossover junction endodeoxyribonuclease RuvC [Bacillus subtilis]|uniref:Crossover junction endodeoxyribonuclease RuvC n=1 Tax=Bacillus subtilis TaxID=1423 RepID=A0AAX3RII9_BACIU|nr:crossover junction endodeoxyribonuclease RuvC [Bacillus subtilis]WGD61866.1 crossover junction endodeoxyribonuclease RuvC [Bacillus subtilis]WGD72256.1 crossover junction endodeoxyribonuclease RuvC [Bacillus subtilis]WGD74964.1 crossover junction endodeoxyribonuclease RuvC [Bacillus subtilis]
MSSTKTIRILALDISTNPGFAVLEVKRLKSGPRINLVHVTSVSTTSQSPDSRRYSYIEAATTMVLHEYGPFDVVVREHFTGGRNKRSTQTVFGAWAVIDMALGKYGYKADVEITPKTVKKDITGNGSASKDEVEAGVRRMLALPDEFTFRTDDESDAVAIGLSYMVREGVIDKPKE